MDLRTEATAREIALAPGSHIKYLYYPYISPQPRTAGGGIPIGVDENGEQIIQYDGKAVAQIIGSVDRG